MFVNVNGGSTSLGDSRVDYRTYISKLARLVGVHLG